MLEFRDILPHLGPLAGETTRRAQQRDDQLGIALRQAATESDAWSEQAERIAAAKTQWLKALPTEAIAPPSTAWDAPIPPAVYSALACDGSQIPLDRHEIAPCYLLNVGRVALHYGTNERPTLASSATAYYLDKDIFTQRIGYGGEVDTETFIDERELATRRFLAEMDTLGELVDSCRSRSEAAAFVDGTLILWNQEAESDQRRAEVLSRFLSVMERAKAARVPIIGYLSRPGSREVIGSLRVTLCPVEGPVVCKHCPYKELESLPCAPIKRLTDADLFGRLLKSGQRSGIYASESHVLNAYHPDDQRIAFFYLHTGAEIARIEIPSWVARDPVLLDRSHAIAFDQCRKGGGYPICLSEAHEQAIIRAPEREAFFRLIEHAMVQARVPALRTAKSVAKRRRRV